MSVDLPSYLDTVRQDALRMQALALPVGCECGCHKVRRAFSQWLSQLNIAYRRSLSIFSSSNALALLAGCLLNETSNTILRRYPLILNHSPGDLSQTVVQQLLACVKLHSQSLDLIMNMKR